MYHFNLLNDDDDYFPLIRKIHFKLSENWMKRKRETLKFMKYKKYALKL